MFDLKKLAPFINLSILYVIMSFLLRIILIFHPITQSKFQIIETFTLLFWGLCSDVAVSIVGIFFLWLYLIFISNSKYYKPFGYIVFFLLVLLLIYVTFFNTILNEYGGVLPEIGITFVAIKTIFFGLMLWLPKYRSQIRYWLFSFVIFLYVLIILQNTISEYFFWNEFGVRYNFIAVDYLVYTNEVIGNIMQSYPVVPIFSLLFVIVGFISYFIIKKSKIYIEQIPTFSEKIKITALYFTLFALSLWIIPILSNKENAQNIFVNELQSNGVYKFYKAFRNSELDYFKFYKTIPNEEAFAILKNQIPDIQQDNTTRMLHDNVPELHKNVVLITIESLSADFMKCYGNDQNITPFLDSLATQSMQFTNLYAVGNRTVRGLEAVTLCFPPTAGESVVKRKDNKNKFATGFVFQSKGYQTKYLYGGDAYFDNMKDFFEGNNYHIVDKNSLKPEAITFSNVWGVCDEDMARKAIEVMNAEAKTGKPFFNHWMTVSNHRPFTYPNGKIDIPSNSKSREGGVKYTDFALKQFFKMAQKQPWFKQTVFVILADHCASSSGKTELPLDKYRIPAMIYAPDFVAPQNVNILMSQIDVMPTLFGLLHFNYKSKFYGQDVLKSSYKPRAFIATYQNLGLIKDNKLTIIAPKQQVKQYDLHVQYNKNLSNDFQLMYEQLPMTKPRLDLEKETISYYQTASLLLKNKQYDSHK